MVSGSVIFSKLATEFFQEELRKKLPGLPGQVNLNDNILVFGKTKEEHHNNLMGVLKRLEENGITLNVNKCQFYVEELVFFGLRFTSNGISPTEDRVKQVREAKAPTNAAELHSFLCSAIYSARFLPSLSSIIDPLWRLLKDDIEWRWGRVENDAFELLKSRFTTECTADFNKDFCTELIVDASPVGLCATIWQYPNMFEKHQRKMVNCASRMLTDVERSYSQAEKKALACVWGCERNEIYLLGKHFELITDNKTVQLIFANTVAKPPTRIERMALRLSQFIFTIVHRPVQQSMYLFLHLFINQCEHSRWAHFNFGVEGVSLKIFLAMSVGMWLQRRTGRQKLCLRERGEKLMLDQLVTE